MFMLCKAYNIPVVCHPPENEKFRAFTHADADEVRVMKPYLTRNMDIVVESDFLVAVPLEDKESPRSGTWATVRYARGLRKTVVLVFPDGRVDISKNGW